MTRTLALIVGLAFAPAFAAAPAADAPKEPTKTEAVKADPKAAVKPATKAKAKPAAAKTATPVKGRHGVRK